MPFIKGITHDGSTVWLAESGYWVADSRHQCYFTPIKARYHFEEITKRNRYLEPQDVIVPEITESNQ